jgi:hypothetical protein
MLAPIFLKSKEEALPDVKNWLLRAFEEKKGCCVPKKEVFGAYVDFCAAHHYESTTSASFGKFLKKIFPGVETRRLVRNDVQAMYYHNLTHTTTECSGSTPPAVAHPRPVLTTSTPTSPSIAQLKPEQTYQSACYATSRPSLPASPTFRISSCSPPPPPAQTTAGPAAPLPYHFDTSGQLPGPPNAQHLYHHFLPQLQGPIPAAGLSWESLYYLHSLLATATQPLPPVLQPKRKTTRQAQAACDPSTIDHNLKRKRVEGHEERTRAGGGDSDRDSDSGDQDKQQPTVQDEPHDYADTRWTDDQHHHINTTTRRTKSRLDYILN